MNKTKNFVFLLLAACLLVACNNEIEESITDSFVKDVELVNENILKFKDQATFDKYLNGGTEVTGFNSLYDLFSQAMDEAESYYERIGGYEEFKAKYSALYFPEEGYDYSAYLPVSNEKLARYVNSEGKVMIGESILNTIDVNNYQKLIELGKAMPTENILRAANDRTIYSNNGKVKLWTDTRIQTHTDFYGGYAELFVEVCFRKKGVLGVWYNYSAGRDIVSGNIYGFQRHAYFASGGGISGMSSHNYFFTIEGVAVPPNGFRYSAISGTLNFKHSDIEQVYVLDFSYPSGTF